MSIFCSRDNGCHTSEGDFQSAEDILDNVLASAGCKDFFNSDSNILETSFDFLQDNVTDTSAAGYFGDSPLIGSQVSYLCYSCSKNSYNLNKLP